MLKVSLEKNHCGNIQLTAGGYERVHTFSKDIRSRVNKIALLEFELAYYDVAVQQISQHVMGTPSLSSFIFFLH